LKREVNKELGSTIIGKSTDIKNIKEQMQMVAQTPDTSVLIIGESGTGKELVARGIHDLSGRNEEIFGAVNMSAIPETLFESEFFGHKKGSFTGAIADRAGWFETTNKGTLFLDEIGEMTRSLQVKLLRVLEDQSFIKLGAQLERKFDIRIISATNKSIEELTNGKSFRTDLFHRLGVFIINVPPLRERKEDIPELVDYFFKMHLKKTGKKIEKIHPEVYPFLKEYAFPGNIRELKNLLERAVIVCQGDQLLTKYFNSIYLIPINENIREQIYDLREIEKRAIIKALQKVNYNKAEAARLLNLEWNALYRRIQKYDIELP
jgi:transcriptional regulator with PAS, ATPase and Fis domain